MEFSASLGVRWIIGCCEKIIFPAFNNATVAIRLISMKLPGDVRSMQRKGCVADYAHSLLECLPPDIVGFLPDSANRLRNRCQGRQNDF